MAAYRHALDGRIRGRFPEMRDTAAKTLIEFAAERLLPAVLT